MLELQDILDAFNAIEPSERLEMLIDFGRDLPPLGPEESALRDAGLYLVHECQAPVFLKVDVEGGRARVAADVPDEAPIARGFAGLLVAVFDGAAEAQLEAAPPDMLEALGLRGLLGMRRTHGLTAIYGRVKEALSS